MQGILHRYQVVLGGRVEQVWFRLVERVKSEPVKTVNINRRNLQ